MQITIHHIPHEILVQTISLTVNRNEPENVFLFFCPKCGYQISQVQGVVARIYPTLEPSMDIPVIWKCPQCRDRYTFQTKRFLPSKPAKITLFHTSENNSLFSTFHCFICRTPLLQYNNSIVVLLPTHRRVMLPIALDCINPECPQRYKFMDVL